MLGKSKEAKKPKKEKKPKLTPQQKALKNKEKVERAAAAKIKKAESKVKKAEQAIKNKEKKAEDKIKKAAQKEANAVKKLEKKQQKAEAKAEKKALAKIRNREIKDEKRAQKMQKRAQLAARTPLQKKADRRMKLKRTAIVILVVALMTGVATAGVKTAPIVAKKLNIPSFNIATKLPFFKEKKKENKPEEEEIDKDKKGEETPSKDTPELPPEEQDDKTLVIAGTKVLHDYYTKALGQFLELDKAALKEQSKVLGNEEAYTGLINGDLQVIFASEPTEKELKMASLAGKTLNPVPVLNGGFVFFINKDNPVKNLTKTQLYNIYTGTVKNWKELGGKDAPIVAFQGTGSFAGQTTIYNEIVSEEEIQKVGKELRRGSTKEMISSVSEDKGAIGFAYYYYFDKNKSKGDVKLLTVNGVAANEKNIATAKYPLTIYSYAIVAMEEQTTDLAGVIEMVDARIQERKEAEAAAAAEAEKGGEGEDGAEPKAEGAEGSAEEKTPLKLRFIKWILSDEGQKMAAEHGFIRHKDPLPEN